MKITSFTLVLLIYNLLTIISCNNPHSIISKTKTSALQLIEKYSSDHHLPDSFNVYTEYETCQRKKPIKYGTCGDSYSFSSVEVFEDRLCVFFTEAFAGTLSIMEVIGCICENCGSLNDTDLQYDIWEYIVDYGLVSSKCFPYNTSITESYCPKTRKCPTSGIKWDPVAAYDFYETYFSTYGIMKDMYYYGSIQAQMECYEDFVDYQGGGMIYTHTRGKFIGYITVRCYGWGSTGGEDYWMCSNYWGSNWGDNGNFLISKGQDECSIESGMMAPILDENLLNKKNKNGKKRKS